MPIGHFMANGRDTVQRLRRVFLPGMACLLITLAGLIHGHASGRWIDGRQLEDATERLTTIPLRFGDWTGTDIIKDAEELAGAEATGYLCRQYQHAGTGEGITVLLLCGPPGPISVHPPTACYRARGYRLHETPTNVFCPVESSEHDFNLAEFRGTTSVIEDRVAILWGWSATGIWKAPDMPRIAFAGQPILFKLYVTWDRTANQQSLLDSCPSEFLDEFLPLVSNCLFAVESQFSKDIIRRGSVVSGEPDRS